MWLVNIPFAYVLSRYTGLPIVPLYLACQMIDLIKCFIGFVLVKMGSGFRILWNQSREGRAENGVYRQTIREGFPSGGALLCARREGTGSYQSQRAGIY